MICFSDWLILYVWKYQDDFSCSTFWSDNNSHSKTSKTSLVNIRVDTTGCFIGFPGERIAARCNHYLRIGFHPCLRNVAVLPCFIMFYHVLPCFTMFYYVLPNMIDSCSRYLWCSIFFPKNICGSWVTFGGAVGYDFFSQHLQLFWLKSRDQTVLGWVKIDCRWTLWTRNAGHHGFLHDFPMKDDKHPWKPMVFPWFFTIFSSPFGSSSRSPAITWGLANLWPPAGRRRPGGGFHGFFHPKNRGFLGGEWWER